MGTAITQRHPIPGMNVIDHVNFAIKSGEDVANRLLVDCANQLFASLGIDLSKVKRIGVCGNTFQMSLFQNIEIRDLAYAGQNMLKDLGVVPPKRDGAVINARSMGIKGVADDTVVIIPPAVRHEIGADAIAMLLITGVADARSPPWSSITAPMPRWPSYAETAGSSPVPPPPARPWRDRRSSAGCSPPPVPYRTWTSSRTDGNAPSSTSP
ncbi:hypothetical protein AUQ37_06035 [Candidatus Methanomethylophilus sp. 1R26]|nr:hypothetical protein AUQ37_06035 [Candidatus Methanomethylophilus sp. 1R26]